MTNREKLFDYLYELDKRLDWYRKRGYVIDQHRYSLIFDEIPGRVTDRYLKRVKNWDIDDFILDKNIRQIDGRIVSKEEYKEHKKSVNSVNYYESIIYNFKDEYSKAPGKIKAFVDEIVEQSIKRSGLNEDGTYNRNAGIIATAKAILNMDISVWDALNQFIGDSDQALQEYSRRFVDKIPFIDDEQRYTILSMFDEMGDEL